MASDDGASESGASGMARITPEWLSSDAILGTLVTAVDVKPVGEVAGFASDTARVAALLADGTTRHLFCKFVLSSGVRGPGMDVPFLHEAAFYNGLAKAVREASTVRLPRCLCAAADALVFVDEVAEAGGRVGDQLAGCSRAQAELVINRLARMHAQFWKAGVLKDKELQAFSPAAMFGDRDRFPGLAGMFKVGAAAHREMLEAGETSAAPKVLNTVPAEAFDGLARAAERGIDLFLAGVARANTCVHADVRLDNMIFVPTAAVDKGEEADSAPGEDVVLLDWQRYGHGFNMVDVAMFIVYNLNAEDCMAADCERELVELYRRTLVASPGFPEAEAAALTPESAWDGYCLAVALLALEDCMAWQEQQAHAAAGKTGADLFSSARMAQLAPSISSNMGAAFVRVGCDDVVAGLASMWTPPTSGSSDGDADAGADASGEGEA